MNIQDAFIKLKDSRETITYLEADGREVTETYAALYENALKVLGGLQSRGLKKGTLLVFQLTALQAQITAFWAGVLGGMIPAILPPARDQQARTALLQIIASLTDPVIIHDREDQPPSFEATNLLYRALLASPSGHIVSVDDEESAMIQFTSGSSAHPKGALLTYKNLYEGGIASSIIVRENTRERYLSWLPLSHCFGFVGYHLVPIVNNFPQYQMSPVQFIKDPNRWLEKLGDFSATVTGTALFGLEHLLNVGIAPRKNIDLTAVYICFCGGEDVNPLTLTAFEAQAAPLGWHKDTLKPAYGLSETTMGVAYTPYGFPFRVEHFLGSGIAVGAKLFFCEPDDDTISRVAVGVLDQCNEVVIRDLTGAALDPEYLGLIHIRGSNVMKGYYSKDPETTAAIDADGWFNTGDLGFYHDGWLTIFGRYKDLIIVNGENYLVTDLEKAGRQALAEGFNLVLVQGKNRQSQANELILVSDAKNPETLVAAGQAIAATWQLPIQWGVLVAAIPQTPSGKTDRLALALGWENGAYQRHAIALSQSAPTTLEGDYQEIAASWAQVLRIPLSAISLDSHFIFDLGGDSLGLIDLICRLEKSYDLTIEPENLSQRLTLKEMTDYLKTLR
jgi:acyl carrier protein